MVQDEKATLEPPKGEAADDSIKEDSILLPKQLATQARSNTKAPKPNPPKGSSKMEHEAEAKKDTRKPKSCPNLKLLFPNELIDENLEGFKEKVARTLQLFP
ncbi:unnamed protein product, partial [Microthlaspi erraticum]